MTAINVLILNACMSQLQTPDITTPATPFAWPLVSYIPSPGVSFFEVHPLLRAAPENPSIDFGGSNIFRGILQVDAVVPDGDGEGAGIALASLVADRFAVGTKLVAGGYFVKFNKIPTIAAAVKDAPWVRFPVSIPYLVITS